MSGILVRQATAEDAEAMLEIYAWYVKNTAVTFEYDVPAPEEFQQRIGRVTERYPWLAAEEDGRILGYAYAAPFKDRTAYDWSVETTIYMDPGARRRGVGSLLYRALEHELKKMGVLNLYACIGVPEQEDEYLTFDSQRFHRRMGYRTVGEFRECGCKFGRWYHMIWMEKRLGDHRPDPAPIKPYPEAKKASQIIKEENP